MNFTITPMHYINTLDRVPTVSLCTDGLFFLISSVFLT